jgi:hypothetical protein
MAVSIEAAELVVVQRPDGDDEDEDDADREHDGAALAPGGAPRKAGGLSIAAVLAQAPFPSEP